MISPNFKVFSAYFPASSWLFVSLLQVSLMSACAGKMKLIPACLYLQDSKAYFHLLEQIAPDGSKEDVPKIQIDMSGVFVSWP